MSVPILSPNRLMSARNAVKFWQTFVMSTTSNQFESHILWSNFLKLVVAAQDYDILHLSHFPEIPGWPKWTFSSPRVFKLLSGEPNVIKLVTWYHVLFLGPWTIHFLFQNTRKVIMLFVTKLQTHLTPSPAGRQLDWEGGCSTGTLPFKDKEKHTVTDSLYLWQAVCVCNIRSVSFTDSLCLSQTDYVCHSQFVSVTDCLRLSHTVCVCHRPSMSVINNLCLSHAVCVWHRHSSWSFLAWFSLIYTWFHHDLSMRFEFVRRLNTTNTKFVDPCMEVVPMSLMNEVQM